MWTIGCKCFYCGCFFSSPHLIPDIELDSLMCMDCDSRVDTIDPILYKLCLGSISLESR